MSTSKERRANNVELKSTFDFILEFAAKTGDKGPIFDKVLQNLKIDPLKNKDNALYSVSVGFDSALGSITIREAYIMDKEGTARVGSHFVLEYGTYNWHKRLTDDDSFVLGLSLTKPGALKLIDTGTPTSTRPVSELKMRSQWRMDQVRFVKITIKNQSVNPQWKPENLRAILEGYYMDTPKNNHAKYIELLREGHLGESEHKAKELEMLSKEGCIVELGEPELHVSGRLMATIQPPSLLKWDVGRGAKIDLSTDEGIFKKENAPPNRTSKDKGWSFKVISWEKKSNEIKAICENLLSDTQLQRLQGYRAEKVRVKLSTEDPTAERQSKAIRKAQQAFEKEAGVLSAMDQEAHPEANLNVKITPVLLQQKEFSRAAHRIPLKPGLATPSINPAWRLNDKAMEFCRLVFDNLTNGLIVLQGPPATGKSTTIARLVYMLWEQATLGTITMITASTNRAVDVATLKVIDTFNELGVDSKSLILRVKSENLAELGRMDKNDDDPVLNEFSLQAHRLRIARTNRSRWRVYLLGAEQEDKTGRAESDVQEFIDQRDTLDIIVYKKVTVICVTAASSDMKLLVGKVNVYTLIIDDAGQATIWEILQAWMAYNPSVLVLTGDPKQLGPLVLSNAGRLAVTNGLMAQLLERNFPHVMLDVNYRTRKELYWPTSKVYYDGLVKTHECTADRPFYQDMMPKLQRISFTHSTQGRVHLTNNAYFFNIANSNSEQNYSKSWLNIKETWFISSLVVALKKSGLPGKSILVLSGYKGHLEELRQRAKDQHWDDVTCGTIDANQGGEADIVIASLCKSGQNNIGFLSSRHRHNVWMSRHRECLLVVGDLTQFFRQNPWDEALPALRENFSHLYQSVSWDSMFFVDGKPTNLPLPLELQGPPLGKASISSFSLPLIPTPSSTTPLAAVATTAAADESKDETMEKVGITIPAPIPTPIAAPPTAVTSARSAELARTLAVRETTLQQVAELKENLKRTAEVLRGLEESTLPFLDRRIKELEEGT